jgi:hypothetical protein
VLREGKPLTRLPVIPASSCDMECCGHQPDGVNQRRGLAGEPGTMTCRGHASGGVRTASRRRLDGPRTDSAVSEAVVDEGDDLAGHGDAGDPAGASGVAVVGGDAGEVGA